MADDLADNENKPAPLFRRLSFTMEAGASFNPATSGRNQQLVL